MPFAVFRRHQRKLLAIFAILAMFGFVLADSLPRLLSGGYGGSTGDTVVAKLYGKSVHRSDIQVMAEEGTGPTASSPSCFRSPSARSSATCRRPAPWSTP